MNTEHTHPSPERAREQLAADRARTLSSPTDRRFHAAGTALFGLTLGVYMSTRNVVSGASSVAATVLFFAIWLGAVAWIEHATHTVPRRAKLWSRVGLGSSLVLGLGLVLPWLNLQNQTQPNTWPMVLTAGLIVAIPSLIAAAVIARGRG